MSSERRGDISLYEIDPEQLRALEEQLKGVGSAALELAELDEYLEKSEKDNQEEIFTRQQFRKIKSKDDLLAHDEEIFLSEKFHEGEAAKANLENLEEIPNIDENTLEQLQLKEANGEEAKKLLISFNEGLVYKVALGYKNKGIELEDLIQEGQIGLMRAVEKYDPTQGNRFSTYATTWIRQKISHALADKSRPIRISSQAHYKLTKVERARREMEMENGEEPSTEQIAEKIGIKPRRVQQLQEAKKMQPYSYNKSINEDEKDSIQKINFIKDEDEDSNPEKSLEKQELKASVEDMLAAAELNDEEQYLVERYYGFKENTEKEDGKWTVKEIGESLGVSHDKARRIQQSALKKLRQA